MLHSYRLWAISALLLLALGAAVHAAKTTAATAPKSSTAVAKPAATQVAAEQADLADLDSAEVDSADLDSAGESALSQDEALFEPTDSPAAADASAEQPAPNDASDSVDTATDPSDKPGESTLRITDGNHHQLRYKFKTGEVVRWEVTHRAVVDSTIGGTNQTAETRSTSIKMWTIRDVTPAGQFQLVHSVESIDMWQKMQGRQEVQYDSRKGGKPPAGYEDVAKAVGIPLTVLTLDAHGKVLKREEKHPQPNASSTLFTIPLPAEPVSVGHEWFEPLEIDVVLQGGTRKKISLRQHFTLQKVSNGVATIEIESQVLTPLNDPAIEAQLIQRLTNGTLKFDIDRGRVLSQQIDLDKRVIGFSGPSSAMHYLTRMTEELLPPSTARVAAVPKPATKPAPPHSAGTPRNPVPPAGAKKSLRR